MYALLWVLKVLQISKRNVVLQIIPYQICVNDSMSLGNRLFVPYLLICASGPAIMGLALFLP